MTTMAFGALSQAKPRQKTKTYEPVLGVLNRVNPTVVRKILINLKFPRHKIISLKVKVT